MKPEYWEGQSHILGAPQGWDASAHGPCVGLPVYIGEGEIVSCWSPSWRERLRLLFGQRVWLTVVSRSMPPVAIEVHKRQKPQLWVSC